MKKPRRSTKKAIKRAQKAYRIIAREPGINRGLLATRLEMPKINNGAIDSVLLTRERENLLISEDANGSLYAFGNYGLNANEFLNEAAND